MLRRRELRDELGLWLTIVFWSFNFLAVKVGTHGLSPTLFTALRFLVAAPLLLLIAHLRGGLRLAPRDRGPVIWGGLLGVTVYQVLFTTAVQLTDVASAAVLVTASPVVSALFGWLTRTERLRPANFVGVALGFAGAAAVVLSGRPPESALAPAPLLGDLAAIGAAIAWTGYGILSAPLVRRVPPLTTTAWQAAVGAVTLLPALVWQLPAARFGPGSLTVLYSALPVTVFGLTYWQSATGRLGPTRALVYLNAEPAIAALAAVWLLGLPLPSATVLGGAAALLGVYLSRVGSFGRREAPVAD